MDLVEPSTHSFIVKMWLEETAEEAGRELWRGHITHVPGGERRYVKDLQEVSEFIASYLLPWVGAGSHLSGCPGLVAPPTVGLPLRGYPAEGLGAGEDVGRGERIRRWLRSTVLRGGQDG